LGLAINFGGLAQGIPELEV